LATRRNRARKQVDRAGGATKRARSAGPRARSHGDPNRTTADKLPSEEEARRKAMAAAFKLLAGRPRSEMELRENLGAKTLAQPEIIDYCIARLRELGYIDDHLMARNYASYRIRSKPVGRSRLARELAERKLTGSAIEEALDSVFDEVNEEALIDRAIEKRIRVHGSPSDPGSARRLFAHLARLGFEYDLIIRKLRALKMSCER
jgi:regulatory protein